MPRALSLLLLTALAATGAGCGKARRPAPPRPPVRLTISAPQDLGTTRSPNVQVSGDVAPLTAHVLVVGELVPVTGGHFSTSVALREGTNVIDVGASAPGTRPTWRALRVTRHSMVQLPELLGHDADQAKATLQGLGLTVNVTNDDDLIDAFRGGPELVCDSDPEGGAQVQPASAVQLVVSKTC